MKVVCAFCKTVFRVRGQIGKCPVCGRAVRVRKKSGAGKLAIVILLFLSAFIFAAVAFRVFDAKQKAELLSVTISDVQYTAAGYIVRGNIRNFSDRTYSVPDLRFVFKDDLGNVLQTVVELPPSGLIEPKSDVGFVKKIGAKILDAKRISVQFAGEQ
ncbi:MAG: hypothetical protein LBQ49_02895 [Rickettsiales bacterium]|jgi:hypothetical protein|nr:hypothetical protein [Rickettsiales bacterium]